ncbi:MAG: hypothetical protein HC890_15670 [Chloroflexaceae bacterium]|nr:hypothetical protein [Chloroflexaceae bacterium]
MIETVLSLIGLAGAAHGFLQQFQSSEQGENVKVDFTITEIELRFTCDDKHLGDFRVGVYQESEQVAYLEGKNQIDFTPAIGFNHRNYSPEALFLMFHMARCYRELQRTGNIDYAKGYDYFRNKLIATLTEKISNTESAPLF